MDTTFEQTIAQVLPVLVLAASVERSRVLGGTEHPAWDNRVWRWLMYAAYGTEVAVLIVLVQGERVDPFHRGFARFLGFWVTAFYMLFVARMIAERPGSSKPPAARNEDGSRIPSTWSIRMPRKKDTRNSD